MAVAVDNTRRTFLSGVVPATIASATGLAATIVPAAAAPARLTILDLEVLYEAELARTAVLVGFMNQPRCVGALHDLLSDQCEASDATREEIFKAACRAVPATDREREVRARVILRFAIETDGHDAVLIQAAEIIAANERRVG